MLRLEVGRKLLHVVKQVLNSFQIPLQSGNNPNDTIIEDCPAGLHRLERNLQYVHKRANQRIDPRTWNFGRNHDTNLSNITCLYNDNERVLSLVGAVLRSSHVTVLLRNGLTRPQSEAQPEYVESFWCFSCQDSQDKGRISYRSIKQ